MTRICLTDGTGRWFETDTAQCWDEDTWWNGNNHISRPTGSQWRHERLYLTRGGRWILASWSQYENEGDGHEEIEAQDAAKWLLQNEHDLPETLNVFLRDLEV